INTALADAITYNDYNHHETPVTEPGPLANYCRQRQADNARDQGKGRNKCKAPFLDVEPTQFSSEMIAKNLACSHIESSAPPAHDPRKRIIRFRIVVDHCVPELNDSIS